MVSNHPIFSLGIRNIKAGKSIRIINKNNGVQTFAVKLKSDQTANIRFTS